MKNKVTVVAHNGGFHADDVFAVAILKILLKDKEIEILRTRDADIISKADYVVDVGGIYDPSKNRFDHHQKGGAGERENGIPFASFGLVWKEYGEKICGNKNIFEKIDLKLVQPVDAVDNGVSISEPIFKGVYPYDIGSYFDAFVPGWKEGMSEADSIFLDMVSVAENLLSREIKKELDRNEGQEIVEEIYKNTEDKRLIVLDKSYPSREVLSKFPEPLYVIFPSENGDWNMKTVRNNVHDFVNRKDLPPTWAGKMGKDLEEVTGVKGAVFCHNHLFIAVAKTKEAILKMAEIALNN